jgi:hypothetical protein
MAPDRRRDPLALGDAAVGFGCRSRRHAAAKSQAAPWPFEAAASVKNSGNSDK